MIRLCLTMEKALCTLQIDGHSGLAPHGQDIVCAGVSALAFAFWEYAQEQARQGSVQVLEEKLSPGELRLCCAYRGEGLPAAARMLLLGAGQIASVYPQNLQVAEEKGKKPKKAKPAAP